MKQIYWAADPKSPLINTPAFLRKQMIGEKLANAYIAFLEYKNKLYAIEKGWL